MLRFAVVLFILGMGCSEDSFLKKFEYYNVMANCLGEDVYLNITREIAKATEVCRNRPIYINMEADNVDAKEFIEVMDQIDQYEGSGEAEGKEEEEEADVVPTNMQSMLPDPWRTIMDLFIRSADAGDGPTIFPFPILYLPGRNRNTENRWKREAFYSSEFLQGIVTKAKAKLSNFTCTLQQLGKIDENYNIEISQLTSGDGGIANEQLVADIYEGRKECYKSTKCLPEDGFSSPVPKSLKRLLAFVKCDKMTRLKACMKNDLRKHLDAFDVRALPELSTADEGRQAEVLLHILWGSESNDFDVY